MTQAEKDAAALWLDEQHQQFFELETICNEDFCYECNRIVEEGTPHDDETHGAAK